MNAVCEKGIGTEVSAQDNGDIHEWKFYDCQVRKWGLKLCIIVDALSFKAHFIVVYAWIIQTIFKLMLKCGILARMNWENQALKIKKICLCNTSTALFLHNTADVVV